MTKFEKSSGDVFRDLGFADADEMLAKAALARRRTRAAQIRVAAE
jgi:hypothetical protein